MSKHRVSRLSLVDTALNYVRYGLLVIALAFKSKRPRKGSHGYKDATTDAKQIRAWWGQDPQCNIGIVTGNDLVVMDFDGQCGKDSYVKLVKLLGAPPPTATVLTPGKGGGTHHYYRTGGRVLPSHVGIAAGVDVRGKGGHAVAPPCPHPDGGNYEFAKGLSFDEIGIAELPQNWVDFLDLGGSSVRTGYYSNRQSPKGNTTVTLPIDGREVTIAVSMR